MFYMCLQCNNPLTKEPKLAGAVRIVPEWTSYDEEIKSLGKPWARENQTHEHTEL